MTDKLDLETIRSLGFDNVFKAGSDDSSSETMFFIGPSGERSSTATDEALTEFCEYLRHTLKTVEDYISNNKNPNTHEWKLRNG